MTTDAIRAKSGFICDMDGVLYHGNRLLPGAAEFVAWLKREGKTFLFLTNSSERSPRELSQKLARLGLAVEPDHFYTSAMATAAFLGAQHPGGSAYVIGEPGLTQALYDAGYSMNDVNPDYVVVGETSSYTYERVCRAVQLVRRGARLVGTNPDQTGPAESGIVPATGALILPIERAAGVAAYFVGKPNPIMLRNGLKRLACRREDAAMIGDRMDTDVVAGVEAGIQTALVLTGVTSRDDLRRYAYQPDWVLENVGDVVNA